MNSRSTDGQAGAARNERCRGGGILIRLLRDARAATMPMMAIAIIPLAGLVGGAVDMSRLYITKTRLQQACDAGALAGRKVMGGGLWTANSNAANTAAVNFFDTNFEDGAYGTTGRTRSFAESAGRVTGTASATVPMTVTKIFNQPATTLNVTCVAEMRLPNTDIMFVLDTTGSMASTLSGDTNSKMYTLKFAVKCFYETVARLATTADCGPDPSGGIGSQTQVRFGFVPYATNVNVGRLLPTNYLANSWPYQSREPQFTTETYYTFDNENGTTEITGYGAENLNYGNWQSVSSHNNQTASECAARLPANGTPATTGSEGAPYDVQESISGSSRTVTWKTRQSYRLEYEYQVYRSNNGRNATCFVERRVVTGTLIRNYRRVDSGTQQTRQVFARWRYAQITHDISGLKNGNNWNAGVSLLVGNQGTAQNVSWDGCIEERETTRQANYTTTTAKDLDIDMVPSSGVSGSHWGPALPGAVFARGSTGGANSDNYVYNEFTSTQNYGNPSYACPTEGKKLQVWSTAAPYETYVDSLAPSGNTHHDIGMIWGARLMSPTGIFSSENAVTPQGGEIERHLIFMTDGQTCTDNRNYVAYGLPWFDRRQTSTNSAPSYGCSGGTDTGGELSEQVDARFTALCTRVKNMNITLWVVYFGTTDTTTVNRMTNCASSGRFFYANNSAQLLTAFNAIAAQISQLRLTQ